MELVTYRVDQDTLYLCFNGRIDASNAPTVEAAVVAIRKENPGKKTVVDADKLEYISSAGLRVILRLRKEEPKLAIINVSPEVYEVLDMTGFTDMITVEKAYRRLCVEGCDFIAKGANGAVFRYDAETVVKQYYNPDALPEIQQEREMARRAFVLGINTAMPYGIVRIGDGYGTVTELLDTYSVSQLIAKNPEDLDRPAKYFVDMLKTIHATELQPGEMPDMKAVALDWAQFLIPHLPEGLGSKLCALVEAVPQCDRMLHGDYHTNNVMVQNEEPLLIDMDTLCMGHPVFELGSMYNAFVGFAEANPGNNASFLGYSYDIAGVFWKKVLAMYLGTEDEKVVNAVEDKARIIGYTRLLRRTIRRNEFDRQIRIDFYRSRLIELLPGVDTLEF